MKRNRNSWTVHRCLAETSVARVHRTPLGLVLAAWATTACAAPRAAGADHLLPLGSGQPLVNRLGNLPPGIPNLPDDVTVVPFFWKPNETALERTKVIIPAELGGHRGNFVLDIGDPDGSYNRSFLKPRPGGGLDTVLATDTADTHRLPEWEGTDSAYAILRIGTLMVAQPKYRGSPYNISLNHDFGNFSWVFAPRLGNIGPYALDPFETIIDYTHQRLILIRLDRAGHRLVHVPAYTPRWTVPLIDVQLDGYTWWAAAVRPDRSLDTVDVTANIDTLRLDTGAPGNSDNFLGYPFLSQFGAIGFNRRTHQFIAYRGGST